MSSRSRRPPPSPFLGSMDDGVQTQPDGKSGYGNMSDDPIMGSMQAVDRIFAHYQLLDRFQIVGADHRGERAGNQVTAEEYERIVAMYSDIRLNQTNLQLDLASGADFYQGATGDIADILTTDVGRGLLDDLAYGQDETTTLRASAKDQTQTLPASGESWADAMDGDGASSVVQYAAGEDVDLSAMDRKWANSDYRESSSDIVLFHELVHAHRMGNGVVQGRVGPTGGIIPRTVESPTSSHDHGTPVEEYAAVGIGPHEEDKYTDNAYRVQRRPIVGQHIPMRFNYGGDD